MLIQNLIAQEWKKGFRAQGYYKNLAVSIMLGFVALYMAVVLLFLGFSLNEILEKANAKLNPLELFNGAMLYIMLVGLTIRFFMQQLNTLNLPPYQVLLIKRSSLINFLVLKPLTSPINYFLLLVVIPFAVKSVVGYYSVSVAIRFVLSFVFLVWFNSLTAAFLKRKFGSGLISFIVVIAVLGGIAALEYFKVFSLFKLSGLLYGFIVLKSYGLILALLFVGVAYLLNRWFFSQNYYAEKFNSKLRSSTTATANLSFLNRFGSIGELIGLELKLILRHKRTKSMLYMSCIFLLYGLMFYTNKNSGNMPGMLFMLAMFISGTFMLIFGQWIISWDSSHFDSLMTLNIPVRTYIKANYYLLIAFNVISFVLTTPYFYFGKQIMYMHLAAFLFNMGVNVFLFLFFATFNARRLDLSKSSSMNYQGLTYKSFLIVLPIMFFPVLIVSVLSAFFSLAAALWTLAGLGFVGIVFRKPLITMCVNQFNRRKYKLAKGFREAE